jgi:hypothetical protein
MAQKKSARQTGKAAVCDNQKRTELKGVCSIDRRCVVMMASAICDRPALSDWQSSGIAVGL